jgi:hypothetical protein
MRENDARRLSHETLEALRERAVRQVQEGESPEEDPMGRWIAAETLAE